MKFNSKIIISVLLVLIIIVLVLILNRKYIESFYQSGGSGSCNGFCYGTGSDNICWCDTSCKSIGDCCGDYDTYCATASGNTPVTIPDTHTCPIDDNLFVNVTPSPQYSYKEITIDSCDLNNYNCPTSITIDSQNTFNITQDLFNNKLYIENQSLNGWNQGFTIECENKTQLASIPDTYTCPTDYKLFVNVTPSQNNNKTIFIDSSTCNLNNYICPTKSWVVNEQNTIDIYTDYSNNAFYISKSGDNPYLGISGWNQGFTIECQYNDAAAAPPPSPPPAAPPPPPAAPPPPPATPPPLPTPTASPSPVVFNNGGSGIGSEIQTQTDCTQDKCYTITSTNDICFDVCKQNCQGDMCSFYDRFLK